MLIAMVILGSTASVNRVCGPRSEVSSGPLPVLGPWSSASAPAVTGVTLSLRKPIQWRN